ncbi:MAG: hypothetical protein R6X23_12930 [Acidimicrobiia bacterium]
MPDESGSKRRAVLVACLGIAVIAGIAGLQLADDAPSRTSFEPPTTTTSKG